MRFMCRNYNQMCPFLCDFECQAKPSYLDKILKLISFVADTESIIFQRRHLDSIKKKFSKNIGCFNYVKLNQYYHLALSCKEKYIKIL